MNSYPKTTLNLSQVGKISNQESCGPRPKYITVSCLGWCTFPVFPMFFRYFPASGLSQVLWVGDPNVIRTLGMLPWQHLSQTRSWTNSSIFKSVEVRVESGKGHGCVVERCLIATIVTNYGQYVTITIKWSHLMPFHWPQKPPTVMAPDAIIRLLRCRAVGEVFLTWCVCVPVLVLTGLCVATKSNHSQP